MATRFAGAPQKKASQDQMLRQAQALLQQAVALHQAGRLAEAQALYQNILKIQPRNFDALHLNGVASLQNGRCQAALELIDQALKINPSVAPAHNNRGKALKDLGRLEEAMASYEKALSLQPSYADAHNNRGNLLLKLGRPQEALASFDQALVLSPNDAEFHSGRGLALEGLRRLDEAMGCFEKALALNPHYAAAYFNAGNVFKALHHPEEALACYDRALALQPGSSDVYYNRGHALTDLKRLEEAAASFETALKINPDQDFLLGACLYAKTRLCDWSQLGEKLQAYEAGIGAGKKATTPFTLLTLLDAPELQRAAATLFTQTKFPKSTALGSFAQRAPGGKIRLGYYSADFHNHATAYLLAQLLEEHDAERFEVYCFSFGPERDDEMRRRVSAAVDGFFDVRGHTDLQVAERSRELKIDIAVDLKGYTQEARPGIFAHGCAPVQVSYLGYPGTMGAEYMHYLVADDTVIPEEIRDCYTENIVYLPGSYQVNDSKRAISTRVITREEVGLPENGFVFCSFNNNYKIHPTTFDGWVRILQAVEGSVLWLLQDNSTAASNLRKETEARGIAGHRLVFAERLPLDEHLARHRLADLFLDTLPCNAHTTASDALWAGLPLLTCTGRSFAGRVAASLLNALDLSELVTRTQEEYEKKAVELACNPGELARLRDKVEKNRLSSPLFDGQRFARTIEAAYQAMFERHQAGLPPALIDLRAQPSGMTESHAGSGG